MFIKNEDTTKSRYVMLGFKVLFLVACVYALALLMVYGAKDTNTVWESDEPRFIVDWEITDQAGSSFEVEAPYRDPRLENEDFTIRSVMPDGIKDGSFLTFITRGNTDVYIDGELRKSFDKFRDISLPGGTVKNFYVLVPVEPEDSGKEIRMTRYRIDRRFEIVPVTLIAGPNGLQNYLLDKYGASFAMSLMLLAISGFVMLIAVGIQVGYRRTVSVLYASTGIFLTAAWVITDSYLFPFVFGHYHIDGVVNYLLCMMLPLAFLFYIDSIQKGRYRKSVIALLAVSFADLLVFSLLHFTNVFSFPQALTYIDIVLGIVILYVFAILIVDIKRGHAGEYMYTLIGFIGFILFGLITIFVLNFTVNKNEGVSMLLGLIFLLAFVIMQQAEDMRRLAVERQKAIRLSDSKTRFLAGMSHEIRTPINSILGMNEMILRENHDPVIDGYARTVQNSSRMLLSLVNDVLDFSKIEAGKMEIVSEEFDLGAMLSEIETIARERAQSKGLDYKTVFLNAVPSGIDSDEVRIRQILINLINNAVKYTDDGSVALMISGSRNETADMIPAERGEQETSGSEQAPGSYNIRFDVRDTGRGIREEDKASLFDAFSRMDMKKNRNIEGTGLGLAIVSSIVNSMGGRITVESEYSVGSTFSVILPVRVTDDTPFSEVPETSYDRVSSRGDNDSAPPFMAPKANILAVDDNNSNLSIVRLFLKRTGMVPDLCLNGNDALKRCREKKYDVILLDHMMPDPDGIETLKLIRNDGASLNKDTPAVVLTANALAGSKQMYTEAGFADYLTKPISSSLLEETVRKFLPAEKVIINGETGVTDKDVLDDKENPAGGDLRSGLAAIEGLDHEVAFKNADDNEELLEVIINEIAGECDERIEKMHSFINDKDYHSYGINAHAIKGLMATIGAHGLSERARRHEAAADKGDYDYIDNDAEGFLEEYRELCVKLGRTLK